jgi:hypothetical protein
MEMEDMVVVLTHVGSSQLIGSTVTLDRDNDALICVILN